MGGARHGRHPQGCRLLTSAARVIPAVPTFAVDRGFWYRPVEGVSVGSVVRIPLGGRRVRGYVVEVGERPGELRPIASVSGRAPVFDRALLAGMEWAATHYVAPLAVVLDRAVPPNVPPGPPARAGSLGARGAAGGVLAGAPTTRAVVADPREVAGYPEDLRAVVESGRSGLVIVPTRIECEQLVDAFRPALGDRLVSVHGDMDSKGITAAWRQAAHLPSILVATPRVSFWKLHDLALAVVVEEGRRAMKDRQTPTLHARDVMYARARHEGFGVVTVGRVPSMEAVKVAGTVMQPKRRPWGLVEVVDRTGDPDATGLLGTMARQAIRAVLGDGGDVFAYAHRRGYAAATRCARCRAVRVCGSCGSRPDPGTACSRCGSGLGDCTGCGFHQFVPLGAGVGRITEELRRFLGPELVSASPEPARVVVGTERDLVELDARRLVVLVDLDGLVLGPNYRAAEEALRIAARLAGAVVRGGRMLVQTHLPEHRVTQALRSGDPRRFFVPELESRRALGYPPHGQLLVLELRGDHASTLVAAELEAVREKELVMGPAETRAGTRWLVQGRDLTRFKTALRPLVQQWRDRGAVVRIDADPIDL